MKSRFASVLVVTATLLAGTAQASQVPKKKTVTLDRSAIVGESVLAAGTYRIEFLADSDTARFVQGKRTVAEAPYKVGFAEEKYPGDAVLYKTPEGGPVRLLKVVFASSGLVVEFPAEPAGGTEAPIATAADRP